MIKRKVPGRMTTIVPGSSRDAEILRDAAPYLSEMGIPVDFEGNADTITATVFPEGLHGNAVKAEKKIYPYDPCPCGLGKKYKKCCGKK